MSQNCFIYQKYDKASKSIVLKYIYKLTSPLDLTTYFDLFGFEWNCQLSGGFPMYSSVLMVAEEATRKARLVLDTSEEVRLRSRCDVTGARELCSLCD